MARFDVETSNTLFDTLSDWNEILKDYDGDLGGSNE